jgi:Cdc6-like AAA superfamily ATPase
MKAINLDQVITFFNQREPLSTPQQLRDWFVQRHRSPRRYLRYALLNAQQNKRANKVLFVGHRGSGKSTELNKLISELAEQFEPIHFDLLEVSGRSTPQYEDLMLALSTQVTAQCIDRHLITRPASDRLSAAWSEVRDWWLHLIAGLDFHPAQGEMSTYAELSTLVGQVEIGVSASSLTHDQIIALVNRHMPELIRRLNLVIDEAQRHLNPRRLLLIVEGLDKIDLESARNIFHHHATTIIQPNADMVFTYPLALRLSDDFQNVRLNFHEHRILHNIAPYQPNGAVHEEGVAALRNLVLKRMEPRLIQSQALDDLILASGGVIVHLVSLVRSAALHAQDRNEDAAQIMQEDVQNAIRDLRDDLSINLRRTDWKLLIERRADRKISNEAEMQRLLYTGALVEYTNHLPWCDVHPVLWPLLNHYADD